MKHLLSFIVAVLLFLGTNFQASAQSCANISVTETTPSTSLSPCDVVSYFVYTITNSHATLPLTSATDTIHLPLGISFVSFNTSGSTAGITTSSATGTMDPVFSIPLIPAAGSVTISITVQTPCSPVITRPLITSSTLNTASITNCVSTVANTMTITTPSLSVTSVGAPILNLNTGDIQDLVYVLKNPSAAGNIPNVNIACSPDASTTLLGYCISNSVSSCPGPYSAIVAGNINISGAAIQSLLSNPYPGIGPGDSLYVHIRFKVVNCSSTPNGSYVFSWGCGPSPCQSITTTTDISSQAPLSSNLNVTTISTFNNSSYCPGGVPVQMGFKYTNNGATITGPNAPPFGNAKIVDMKLYIAVTNEVGSVNPATFRINGNPTPLPNGPGQVVELDGTYSAHDVWRIDLNLLSTSLFSLNPSPYGINSLRDIDGDGFIDDLQEGGDNFTLTFDFSYATTCPASFANCGNKWLSVSTQEKFENQCHSLYTVGDVHTIPYSITNTASASYFYGTSTTGSTMTAPPDVQENDTFNLNICPRFSQLWGPNGYDFNCPNGYHQFRLDLPFGYHINTNALSPAVNGGTMSIPLYERCTGLYPTLTATVTEFPPVGTTPGYVLINSTRIPTNFCGPWNETDNVLCFNVELYFECTSDTSIANFGGDNFDYTLEYICDPACITCADELTCASTSTYHHCLGSCTMDFSTDALSFTFKRTTLGYENSATPLDNCTNPPVTVSNLSAINLQAAYPGDAIKATLSGGFTGIGANYSAMFMQVRYDQLLPSEAATPDLFIQDPSIPSTILIQSTSLGLNILDTVTYSFTNATPAEMNFKISPWIYPLLNAPDVVFTANIHLIAKSSPQFPGPSGTFYSYGPHKLTNLRSEFAGVNTTLVHPNDTIKSCDSWGDNFTILQPEVQVFYYPDASFNQTSDCDPYQVSFNFRTRGALWTSGQPDFPNEFRPYAALDNNVVITLPPGYQYTNSTMGVVETNYSSSAPNFFQMGNFSYPLLPITPVSVVTGAGGTTLTYNGRNLAAACWPLLDADYWYAVEPQYDITVYMLPTCDAPPTSGFTWNSGYTQSIQQPDPSYQFHRNVNFTQAQLPVYHQNPNLNVTTTATVNAYSNVVDFSFTVCNNSSLNAPFPWVTFQSPGGTLSFTGVTIPPNPALLSAVPYGVGGLLVNLGAIPANTCVTFQLQAMVTGAGCVSGPNAVNDSILVGWGNECTMPATLNIETLCQQGTKHFNFLRYPSDLNLLTPTGFPSDSVNLCGDTLIYDFNITNPALGTVTFPTFWMNLPPGIIFQDATFTYPYGIGTTVTSTTPSYTFGVSATDPGWNLNSLFPALASSGLTGAQTSLNNQVGVQIKVITSCGYNPNDYLEFFAGGTSACSQSIVTPPAQHRPTVLNASLADSLAVTVNINDSNLDCTDTATLTVTVTNNGTTGTSNNNVLSLVVPNPLAFSNMIPPPASSTPVAGGTMLTWNLNPLSAGGTQTITFTVGMYSALFCAPLSISALTYYTDSVYCSSTNSSCVLSDTTDGFGVMFMACCSPCTLSAGADDSICYGASSTLTASGGTSYTWMPGNLSGSSVTVSPATTTSYTVSSTNSTGITCYDTVTVYVNPQLTLTLSATPIACYGQSADQASAVVSGGTPGYSYSWSPAGGTGSTANGLPAGTYTVTVTDAAGCTVTQTLIITQPSQLTIPVFSQTNVTCFGANNGTASVSPSGGTPGYSYSWSPSGGTAATATGLAPGSYTVTVSDANNCQAQHVFNITQPPKMVLGAASTNVSCNGGSNGTASVIVMGGTPGYTYSWAPSGGTASNATGLTAGSYTCTVTDANGCTAQQVFTITQPSAMVLGAAFGNVSCFGGSNGFASVVVMGGTPGYTYSWSPSGGTGSTASGLGAGTYTCTVTDANGCTAFHVFIIKQPPVLKFVGFAQNNVSCNGGSNGLASVVVSGGTPGYTYSWAPSGGTGPSATGLSAGTYTCTVTDANGCTISHVFTITQPAPLTLTVTSVTHACFGTGGGATVVAGGGTPPYTYLWSPGGYTTPTISGVTPGPKTCTVTDSKGCTKSVTFNIRNSAPVIHGVFCKVVYITPGNLTPCTTLSATVTGAFGTVNYSWSTSATTSSITVCPGTTTSYTLTVTDGFGCTATAVYTVYVIDARCGPLLNKVKICKGSMGGTLCLTPWAAAVYLATHPGSYLGSCQENPCSSMSVDLAEETIIEEDASEVIAAEEGYLNAAPNPLNESTNLMFGFQHSEHVVLKVYDLSGKEVASLFDGPVEGGQSYTAEFNASALQSGMYVAVLRSTSSGKEFRLKLLVQK